MGKLKDIARPSQDRTSASTFIFNPRSHGVMVSTLDSESSDPSSNLGGTSMEFFSSPPNYFLCKLNWKETPWLSL